MVIFERFWNMQLGKAFVHIIMTLIVAIKNTPAPFESYVHRLNGVSYA